MCIHRSGFLVWITRLLKEDTLTKLEVLFLLMSAHSTLCACVLLNYKYQDVGLVKLADRRISLQQNKPLIEPNEQVITITLPDWLTWLPVITITLPDWLTWVPFITITLPDWLTWVPVITITLPDWLTWLPGDVTYTKSLGTNLCQSEHIICITCCAATC